MRVGNFVANCSEIFLCVCLLGDLRIRIQFWKQKGIKFSPTLFLLVVEDHHHLSGAPPSTMLCEGLGTKSFESQMSEVCHYVEERWLARTDNSALSANSILVGKCD
jgi:hypothetical protein